MPLPGPPEIISQGWRTTCHIPANSTRGLPGTMTRSDTPVVSFTNRTFCHVLPPSDRKSTRLNSSHLVISYAVFCLKKKNQTDHPTNGRPTSVAHTHRLLLSL